MEEEKDIKPNKKIKPDELKFGFVEVLILVIITAIVTIIVANTINNSKKAENNNSTYNKEIEKFYNEYKFVKDKYYGEVKTDKLINDAIAGMVNGLGDPYSTFINDENVTNFDVELDGEFYGLGIEITVNENSEIEVHRVLDGYEAKKSGIQVGDVITHMDGESLEGISTVDFRSKMIQNNKETVTLTIKRDGKTMDITVKRTLVQIESVKTATYHSGASKVGYIGITIFANNTYKQFKEALAKLENEKIDSLIVDVRSNSGGHLQIVTDIISEFVDSSHVIYQVKDATEVTKEYSTGKENKSYPIIVLIDSASASASELLASALKEQAGAKLVGTKSFGKSTVQQVVDLGNGSKYKITIKEWLTSEGNVINGQGLVPDVEVMLGEAYFNEPIEKNDTQLNEAIKLLKK